MSSLLILNKYLRPYLISHLRFRHLLRRLLVFPKAPVSSRSWSARRGALNPWGEASETPAVARSVPERDAWGGDRGVEETSHKRQPPGRRALRVYNIRAYERIDPFEQLCLCPFAESSGVSTVGTPRFEDRGLGRAALCGD